MDLSVYCNILQIDIFVRIIESKLPEINNANE
jgi:hypothetical protein